MKKQFLMAYDSRGLYICDYLIVKMRGNKEAVLPIPGYMKGYYRKLLRKWMKGEKKVVWRDWRGEQLRGLAVNMVSQQEAAFYRLLKPLIEDGHMREKVKALKKIGVLRMPKTVK